MRTDPLVTVVIPTQNRAAMLACAIHSVQQQTYKNLEIIVVDDASGDDTREIVERLGDSRIRYIRHGTSRGASAARNTGIRTANGQFIAFLDYDDAWEPEKTEEQVTFLRDYDVVLCASTAPGRVTSIRESKETVDLGDLRRGRFTGGGTGVLMARASVLKETMFDESLPCHQDWDVFIRIALKHRIGYLNKVLLQYNHGNHVRITNKTLNVSLDELEQRLRMLRKHKGFFGGKWFKRHACRVMLYGIKHRRNRMSHIVYTARRYGVFPVLVVLGRRLLYRARIRLVHVS